MLPPGALVEGVGGRVGGGEREAGGEARGVDEAVPTARRGVPVPAAGEALAPAAWEALPAVEGVPPKEAEAGAGVGVSKGPGDAVPGAVTWALGVPPCTVTDTAGESVARPAGLPVALPVAVKGSVPVGSAVLLPTTPPAAPAEVRVACALGALEAEAATALAVAARGREGVPVVVMDGEAVESLGGERVEEALPAPPRAGDDVGGVGVAVGAALEGVNACVGEAGEEAEMAEEGVWRRDGVGRGDCVAGKGERVEEVVAAPLPPLPGEPGPHSPVGEGLREEESPLGVRVLAAPREAEAEVAGEGVRVGRVREDTGDMLAPAGGEAVKRKEGVSLASAGL